MRQPPLDSDRIRANPVSVNAVIAQAGSDPAKSLCQAGHIHGDVNFNNYSHEAKALPFKRYRIGLVPSRADCFQHRATAALLVRALANGKTVLLSGMGGVGKTQLAVDYAEQMWAAREIDLLIWLTANSRDEIVSGYAAGALEFGVQIEGNSDKSAERFLRYLETTHHRWLLVLDDLQTPDDLRRLLPQQVATGRVVITTRRNNAALSRENRQTIKVDLFTPTESMSYLKKKLGNLLGAECDAHKLIEVLDNLPLALAHAAAYMIDEGLSSSQYCELFSDQCYNLSEIFPEAEALPDDYDSPIPATWSLSIKFAGSLRPVGLAPRVLEIASVLDSNVLPAAALWSNSAIVHLTEVMRSNLSPKDIRSALNKLRNLSLVDLDLDKPCPWMRVHTLVQRTARDKLHEPDLATIAHVAADALLEIWLGAKPGSELSKLAHNSAAALERNVGQHLWQPEIHPILFRFGQSLGENGLLFSALSYNLRLCNMVERQFGPDHTKTLCVRGSLAHRRGESGDFTGAIAAHKELLPDQERVLGPNHPDTLRTRSGLAHWTGKSGDTRQAITILELLLVDMVYAFGLNHPETLRVLASLAHWHGESGDLTGAIERHKELLPDQERVLGPNHPDTLRTRRSLTHWQNKVRAAFMSDGLSTAFKKFDEGLCDWVQEVC